MKSMSSIGRAITVPEVERALARSMPGKAGMLLVLLGLLVVATDAPSAAARPRGDSAGSPLPEEKSEEEKEWWPNDRRRFGLTLGVSTPMLPRGANLSIPFDPNSVYEGMYEEAWSTCLDSLWNTCVGRCGQALAGAPYVCGCDSSCRLYGDCCLDYDLECTFEIFNSSAAKVARHMGELQCVSAARDSKYGVLMISGCADWWPPFNLTAYAETIEESCLDPSDNSLHPVDGRRGLIYKNNFCAMCNGVFDAEPWSGSTSCVAHPTSDGAVNATDAVRQRASWLDSCTVHLDKNRVRETEDSYRVCTFDVSDCATVLSDRAESGGEDGAPISAAAVDLCSAYSKPVFRQALDGSTPTYKNVHCAHCNNVPSGQLYCPAWRYIPTGGNPNDGVAPYLFFETGLEVDEGDKIKEIPASFAILFNFGQHNNVPVPIFSSQQKSWWDLRKSNCDDSELWDPFSEVCRKIYCSSEFSLLDFKCIDVYDNVTSTPDEGVVIPDNVTDALTAVDVSEVLVTLALQLDDCLSFQVVWILEDEFVNTFAASLNVSANRFSNFTVGNVTTYLEQAADNNDTTCERELQVWLTLLGPDPTDSGPQPSIEMVSASMAYSVSLNHMFLYFEEGITARVFGVQEKLTKLVNNTSNDTLQWCADGLQVMYQNGDFTPLIHFYSSDNYSVDIFINSTGRTYPPGQFLGNILFQGDQRSTLANVTGLVVVCEMGDHNDTCWGVQLNRTEYLPLPNGSIVYVGSNTLIRKIYNPGSYDILPNGNAFICLSLDPDGGGGGGGLRWNDRPDAMRVMDMQIQSLMSTMLLSYSSLAMVVTIFTYLCFAELRNVPGKNLLNLTVISLFYQLTFLSGMRPSVTEKPTVCKAVAIGLHYSILSSFFWMNVIAYNLYKTFAGDHLLANSGGDRGKRGSSSTTSRYAFYAYGCPLLIVGVCTALDVTGTLDIGYGDNGACWIGSPLALLVTFAGVIALVLLANLLFYVLTVRSIRRISRKTKLTTGQRGRQNELVIYVRMSSAMGFTWLFGFLSGIPDLPYAAYDVFSYLFVILNTLQGIFIFFAFVCTGKVLALYAQSAPVTSLRAVWAQWRRASQKPISRTVSNETCKSVVSLDDDEYEQEQQRCREGVLIDFQDGGAADSGNVETNITEGDRDIEKIDSMNLEIDGNGIVIESHGFENNSQHRDDGFDGNDSKIDDYQTNEIDVDVIEIEQRNADIGEKDFEIDSAETGIESKNDIIGNHGVGIKSKDNEIQNQDADLNYGERMNGTNGYQNIDSTSTAIDTEVDSHITVINRQKIDDKLNENNFQNNASEEGGLKEKNTGLLKEQLIMSNGRLNDDRNIDDDELNRHCENDEQVQEFGD